MTKKKYSEGVDEINSQNIFLNGYQLLAIAIIRQASKDYIIAIRKGNASTIRSCERFFRSSNYQMLTAVDGEYLIRKLRESSRRMK